MLICGLLLPAVAPAPPIGMHDLDGTQARLWSVPFPGVEPAPGSLNLADSATRMQRKVLPLRIGRTDLPYLFLLQLDVPKEHVGKAAVLRVLTAHLGKIVFYLPDGQMVRAGVTQSGEAGLALMPSPWPAARVPLDRPTLEVWVYVDAGGPMIANFELMSESASRAALERDWLLRVGYYALLCVLAAISVFGWFRTGQRTVPAYLAFLGCTAMCSLFADGLVTVYLLPVEFASAATLQAVCLNLACVSAMLLSLRVLEMESSHPRLVRFWRGGAGLLLGTLALIPLGQHEVAVILTTVAILLNGVVATTVCALDLLRGATAARVLVFAAYVGLVGFQLLGALAAGGLVPASGYVLHSWQLGSLLHLLLLHAAIAWSSGKRAAVPARPVPAPRDAAHAMWRRGPFTGHALHRAVRTEHKITAAEGVAT